MADEPLVISRSYEGVVTLELNRPEARNALSEELRGELATLITEAGANPEVRCIIIAGNDEYFASGADIHALRDRDLVGTLDSSKGQSLWQVAGSCSKPLIAAVSGYALGGGFELVLACDMVIASESAQFGTPEVTLGIIPGGGATQRLARVVGKQKAMELVLTGRRISAFEARDLGLVNDLVPKKEDWLAKALDLALVIARRPPIAVRMGKQAVLAAEEMPMNAALAHERRLFEIAMATEDRVEGMTAFIEKRPPKFKGS
ncbi:MAG: enoyl-CoA hydratase-related protein [Solirubrobacterales bacterium]